MWSRPPLLFPGGYTLQERFKFRWVQVWKVVLDKIYRFNYVGSRAEYQCRILLLRWELPRWSSLFDKQKRGSNLGQSPKLEEL